MTQNPVREEILAKLSSKPDLELTQDESDILKLRWGLESGTVLALVEVAHVLGKDAATVRQLEKSALKKLRV